MTVNPTSEITPAPRTAFVYGTLMLPRILKRVLGHDGVELQLCPGVLLDHTRHKVKYASYPGMVPYTRSRQVLFGGRELSRDENCVRGTLVFGLTDQDVKRLDRFENTMYTREKVKVYKLEKPVPLASLGDLNVFEEVPSLPADLREGVDAETYIWINLSDLKEDIWTFEEFMQGDAWKRYA